MQVIDLHDLARFAAALVFVLALMGGLALVMRRFSRNHPLTLPHKKRLKILEVLPLDSRRRLILLKRDDREHLVILGANGETLIESGIEAVQDSEEEK